MGLEKEMEEKDNQLYSLEQQRNDAAEQHGKLRIIVNELEQSIATYKEYRIKCEQLERNMEANNRNNKQLLEEMQAQLDKAVRAKRAADEALADVENELEISKASEKNATSIKNQLQQRVNELEADQDDLFTQAEEARAKATR